MGLRSWLARLGGRVDAGAAEERAREGDDALLRAADSLRALLEDPSIPAEVRSELAADYAEVEAMLGRLEQGQIHIAAFGRVSVGKSSLLNALAGTQAFETGVLHGTTTARGQQPWVEAAAHGVELIDTPGINELSGEAREKLAFEVARRSDLILFVCDADLTSVELDALRTLANQQRPLLLVLNKADRYREDERQSLLARLAEHASGLVQPQNILEARAQPAPERVLRVDSQGNEQIEERAQSVDVSALRARIYEILEAEGKALAALNAALFAGDLADSVGERLTRLRAEIAARITKSYCLAKGMAVALNPVPVADLLAAAALDVALVVHLSKVYGLPMSRAEASRLLATVAAQLAALMGAIWGVHLVASALKGMSAGLSTALTAGAQGALAWYATLLVARAAERYLAQGKSWGDKGPKRVVAEIVESLDRDSVLREAREEILRRLKKSPR
jgi:GTP-binding protein Era